MRWEGGSKIMAELISMSYEQARAEYFKTLKDKAEHKMNYWAARVYRSRPNNLNDPAHIKASEYGAEYSYYNDALEALENQPKWIRAEEPPMSDEPVLCCYLNVEDEFYCTVGSYCGWCFPPKWELDLDGNDHFVEPVKVTHWMHLPGLPEEVLDAWPAGRD